MNVKELIEHLQKLPQEAEVIMSKDSEGNAFSPYVDFSDKYHYVPESTSCGYLWGYDDEEEESEKPDNAVPCVVLWPES